MSRLLIKALILTLPFCLILAAVEFRLRQLPNSYSDAKAGVETARGDVEIFITGASHARNGILPEAFSRKAYNLANGSQSLYYDAMLVEKYSGEAPGLRYVIVTISYHSLRSQLKNSMERWRGGFYKQVFGIPSEDDQGEMRLSDYSYIGLYSPKLAYKLVWDDIFVKKAADQETDGFGQYIGDISPDFGKKRVKLHETEMRAASVQPNIEYLEHLIRTLKTRGVKVIFITVPVHHTYSDNIDPAKDQEMQDTIAWLSREHDIPYFNHFRDPRFDDSDFVNSDHLNSSGAAKFTHILEQEALDRHDR